MYTGGLVSARAWLCALLLALAGGCSHPAPEQLLRDTISALQAAVAARDAGEVERFLAEDFIGTDRMDRFAARRLATGLFLRYRDIGTKLGPLQVAMTDDSHATVSFTVVTTGGNGTLPENGRVYAVTTGWRLEDGDWFMTSAQWIPRL